MMKNLPRKALTFLLALAAIMVIVATFADIVRSHHH